VILANVGDRATLKRGERGVDVERASQGRFGPDIQGLYEEWAPFVAFAAACDAEGDVDLDSDRLGSPSPRPRQVFGIGLNYRAHAAESGVTVPDVPATFTKFPACLTGPFRDVVLPSDVVDWEVELVVVIGARCHRIDASAAWQHVAGVTVGQDLSERTVQFAAGGQFSLGKSYEGFGPMGPWLVTPDELPDPDDLALGCAVNGETVQDSRTSDMAFAVGPLLEALAAVVPLLPGDVIFTGTPEGVGMARQPPRFLSPGDVVESWIEGIGTIRNRMTGTER
jgi:2-keto-4-pentenoate hydratase/2-oxohepta-3-ene-1,7-dioic acid hydratase in catechol pathway